MLKQFLQLLGIESDAFCTGLLLRQSLVDVEVIADDLDSSSHDALHLRTQIAAEFRRDALCNVLNLCLRHAAAVSEVFLRTAEWFADV